jgi:RNA polymerase sigma factor (sigma-70 family)
MPYDDRHRMDGTDRTRGDDTATLVRRAAAGDDDAFGRLYDLWFDRAYDTAYRVVRDHAAAADVAQETFLRAWRSLGTVRDPEVFGGWLLRIARNAALNQLRVASRTSAVDDEGLAMIERRGTAASTAPAGFRMEDRIRGIDDPASAAEDAELADLVQESVGALDGRDAEVLDLGLRYGLSPAEIGEAAGLSRNAANQAVHRARGHLRRAVEARVLWHGGAPRCAGLTNALAEAGVTHFDARAVRAIDAHAAQCEECAERRRLHLDPAVLFAVVPLAVAPSLLKAKVAAALAMEGVPMQGSAAVGAPPNPTSVAATTDREGMHAPDEPNRASTGIARRVAAVAIGVLGVVAGLLALSIATDNDEPRVLTRALEPATTSAGTTPSTTSAPTTGTGSPAIAPGAVEPAADDPVGATTTPTVVSPTTTTTAPPVVTASLTMSPSTVARPWTVARGAPRLVWTTEHAATVAVSGPGFSASAPDGSSAICPTGSSSSVCNPAPGTYRYRLVARDSSGEVVATREVLLVVN